MLANSNLRLFWETGLSVLYPRAGYHVKSAPIYICQPRAMIRFCETYIDREFTPHPRKLPRIGGDLLYPTRMRLPDINRISPQGIDDLQVLLEHIRVLIIFARDVSLDGG